MVYMPHWPSPTMRHDITLGLSRMKMLLNRLGNPENSLPPLIHVSGTNGKGSTTAYLKAILEKAGLKVHRYTSPHLFRFNQRIEVASKEISDHYLYQVLEETRIKTQDIHATFFEYTTAAALLAFANTSADVAILEVGMGGRLDATNVVTKPMLSIITPVGMDHMEFLGDDIRSIAYEKAGIIKNGCDAVISWQYQDAMDVLIDKAKGIGATYYAFGKQWNLSKNADGFDILDNNNHIIFQSPNPSLLGVHQIINAAASIASCKYVLSKHFNITNDNIAYGISNAVWPGRLQKITSGYLHSLLPPEYELWMDGAHNQDGAAMLASSIRHMWGDKPTILINGRTGQRDITSFLQQFLGVVEAVHAVTVQSEPNGEKAENIFKIASELGFQSFCHHSVKDAVLDITSNSAPCRILATGSLYLLPDIVNAV